jgi:hypothetical protein
LNLTLAIMSTAPQLAAHTAQALRYPKANLPHQNEMTAFELASG